MFTKCVAKTTYISIKLTSSVMVTFVRTFLVLKNLHGPLGDQHLVFWVNCLQLFGPTFWAWARLMRSIFSVIFQFTLPSSILHWRTAWAPFSEAHPKSWASSISSDVYSNIGGNIAFILDYGAKTR